MNYSYKGGYNRMSTKKAKAQKDPDYIVEPIRFVGGRTQMDWVVRSSFGKRLEALMNGENPYNKVVNVQELGDSIGMTRQAITKYLNLSKGLANSAVPSILVLNKIALFFGVTANYLLGMDGDTSADTKLQITTELLEQMGIERTTFEKLCAFKAATDESKAAPVLNTINAVIRGTLNELSED